MMILSGKCLSLVDYNTLHSTVFRIILYNVYYVHFYSNYIYRLTIFLIILHLNFICCHIEYLLPLPLQEIVSLCLRNIMSLSGMNFILYLYAATLPIHISCMGMFLGNGSEALRTLRLKAIQQPVYPFFHIVLYMRPCLTCIM